MNGSGEQRDRGHRPGPAVRGLGRAAARHGLRRRRGVLPRRRVRVAAFAVIAAAIFACGVLCLLAVWDFAKSGTAWRALASLGVVAGTMGAFSVVNEWLSGVEADDAAAGFAGEGGTA